MVAGFSKPPIGSELKAEVDTLHQIISLTLNALKTDDKKLNDTLEKFKEIINKTRDPGALKQIRKSLADFIIKYDEITSTKAREKEQLILSTLNILLRLARDVENSEEWHKNIDETKALLKKNLSPENLNKAKKLLLNTTFMTKDTKETIYRDILEMMFALLNVPNDSPEAKKYMKSLESLRVETFSKPTSIENEEVRNKIKQIIEEKEKLENKYMETLNEKLSKALKALIYAINTFGEHPSKYMDTFQQHINELADIGEAIENRLASIDINEISQRFIGIVMKIRQSTQAMQEELRKYTEELRKSREIIEDLQKQLKQANENLLIDPLTNVYNRRGMMHFLMLEMNRARRYKNDLSIAIADLDHFSNINNTYGHLTGDKVLQKFCEIAQTSIRKTDIITRYGGEEFLIILPNTNLEQAKLVSEKIRKRLSEMKFQYKDNYFTLTVSFGVTQFSEKDSMELLIKRADSALYEAKKTRNAVVVKEPS